MQLSWDLHVHPGPSSVPRWGSGAEIRGACARAGITGFVWKSRVTTDFGQPDVGDPYVASQTLLDILAVELGGDVTNRVAVDNPRRLAERVVTGSPA